MKIKYLCAEGVLEVEQGAFREIEKGLPANWFGFAGFQLLQRGSTDPRDLDLVIFATHRIFLVELKNWRDEIEYSNRQWLHKGKFNRSPVDKTRQTVKVLGECLRAKLPNTPIPYIEHLVVLCHPTCRLKNFPDEERRFVMNLPDFVKTLGKVDEYRKKFPEIPLTWQYPSANPLPDRNRYELFFSLTNPQILERKTEYQGFLQVSSVADYIHPKIIWSEFSAVHRENRRSRALIRKWNFSNLAGGNSTAAERASIGLRELRLNEMLRTEAPDLHDDLLEPVGSASPEDVTTNFVEAYRLPAQVERLGELITRKPEMADGERCALVKSVLARFAKLHSLGIAHRDITTRTLWVVEPSRIILSSFAAARIPEGRTVGANRVELETGSIRLPEDDGCADKLVSHSAFARDVFLLGVLSFEIFEGTRLEDLDSVPLYDEKNALKFPMLNAWFQTCINWDPAKRYQSASEALDALNLALAKDVEASVSDADISVYKTDASPMTFLPKEIFPSLPGKNVYVSEKDGEKVLVKCWPNLRFDIKHPSRNRKLLEFLQTARSLRQSAFNAAPEVVDFGVSPFGLILVTKWAAGEDFHEWFEGCSSNKERAEVALSLLNAVRRLHALGITHGDIKEANIAVSRSDDGNVQVVLLDVLDLTADGDSCITVDDLPMHLEGGSALQRDLYLTVLLALKLLSDIEFPTTYAEASRAKDLTEINIPIDLLAETLQKELYPPKDIHPTFVVSMWRTVSEQGKFQELEGDNGIFPVGVQPLPAERRVIFFVTGLRQQVIIKYDLQAERVTDISLKEIGHDIYVTHARRSAFRLHAHVEIQYAAVSDASELIELLYSRYRSTRDDNNLDESFFTGAEAKNPYERLDANDAGEIRISAKSLWQALAESDELNATRISVRPGVQKIPREEYSWLVPYELEEGVLDFSDGEKIELYERGTDPMKGTEAWFRVGLISPDIGKDILRVLPTNNRLKITEGKTFFVRGSFETNGSERRVTAMRRVLSGGASIQRLHEYFDPYLSVQPYQFPMAALDSIDNLSLNDQQRDALLQSFINGPISLLQGPPGTGKTKFISSFVHLVLSRGLAKNILLVSQSHEAVNNALEKVSDLATSNGVCLSMVRVGSATMVSKKLRLVHEDARRQIYREKFDAEIRERIRAVGYQLGLPRPYVDVASDVFMSLGQLLGRVEFLQSADYSNRNLDEGKQSAQISRLKARFCEIARSRFNLEVSEESNLRDAMEVLLSTLAESNGSPSPEKCQKLQRLFWLSKEFSDVLRSPHSNFTSFLSRTARVVAGTCVGVGKHMLGIVDHIYDWVIVDEAARASPMELVVAMQAGRRVLLVGDHLQLPPMYPRAVEEKTSQLLEIGRADFRKMNNFQRAFSSEYGRSVGRTLLKQYRMASSINRVVSNCFYEGALTVDRDAPITAYEKLPAYLAKEVVWIDTSDQGRASFHKDLSAGHGSLVNEVEANIIVSVVREIVLSKEFVEAIRIKVHESDSVPIGIITMYAA
jgi:serine/threonine protein kinase